jgi:hypothetical protein
MRILIGGGTINDDFQSGVERSSGLVGRDPIVVTNSCKDFLPSEFWVCVCLPGLRFFHVDARWFGLHCTLRTTGDQRRWTKELRDLMARQLGAGGFADANALWQYAIAKDLPRFVEPAAARRFGLHPETGVPQ